MKPPQRSHCLVCSKILVEPQLIEDWKSEEMNKILVLTCAFLVFAFIGPVLGDCEDDLVPLEAGQLPKEWNIGTIPHLFHKSRHMRGVISVKDLKILGLDTMTTSLKFCPINMTIYGNLTARRIQLIAAGYGSNIDYLTHGTEVVAHGDGLFDVTLKNVVVKNIIAKLRYSRATKKLEIDEDMEYEIYEEMEIQTLTGFEADKENGVHTKGKEEWNKIEQSNAHPSVVELVKHIINYKAQKGTLAAAAKQIFADALSL